MTVNPSVGAGLGVCTPAQYAAETATSNQGDGCPNASKIGDFTVTTPLFSGILDGAIYLAQPDDPATSTPGAENPFDTLVAVYLVARLQERGVLVKLAGKIVPDPGTGTLTATFDGLPELPYTNLNLTFRTGQRAFLITPPACGAATTQDRDDPLGGGDRQPDDHRLHLLARSTPGSAAAPARPARRPSTREWWREESTPTSIPTPPTSST